MGSLLTSCFTSSQRIFRHNLPKNCINNNYPTRPILFLPKQFHEKRKFCQKIGCFDTNDPPQIKTWRPLEHTNIRLTKLIMASLTKHQYPCPPKTLQSTFTLIKDERKTMNVKCYCHIFASPFSSQGTMS